MVFDRLILRYFCILCVVTTLFVLVTSQDFGLVHFSKNKIKLIEFIENHTSIQNIQSNESDPEIKTVIDFVAGILQEQTKSKRRFRLEVMEIVNAAAGIFYRQSLRARVSRTEVLDALVSALLDCSDPTHVSDDVNNQALPYFLDERFGIGLLLNYALVNWPYPMETIINSPRRRVLLRRFAEEALSIFECAYSSVRPDDFTVFDLPNSWRRRAHLFYDEERLHMPYIDHIYTEEHPFPHTHGDTSVFVNLRTENFAERSPRVEGAALNHLSSLRRLHRERQLQYGLFGQYEREGMSTADYYLEMHLSRLYRIMFIFMELLERGVRADSDHYEGAAFDAILSRRIQAILYDDNAYREYLHRRRVHELSRNDNINQYRRNLETSRTPSQEDLIMLFWIRVRNYITAASTSTTTTTTTSTPKITSTTTSYRIYPETGRDFRKFFSEKLRKCLPDNVYKVGKFVKKFVNNQISDDNELPYLAEELMFTSMIIASIINMNSGSILQESMCRSCLHF